MPIRFYFLFFILCCLASLASSQLQNTNTLQQGYFLNTTSILSLNGKFSLLFYQPKDRDSHYLAIWCYEMDDYVWLGNRNRPMRGDNFHLLLDSFGNLIFKSYGSFNDSIEIYSSSLSTKINAAATLLDTGNFVIREINFDGSVGRLLWQSFDYPTDTLLPEMKLGVDHRTGLRWKLTSRFNDSKPEDGAFTLEWDPIKKQLIVKRRGVVSWSSGSLNDREFEFILFEKDNVNYEFFIVSNETEDSFCYTIGKKSSFNKFSGWLLDYQGKIKDPKNSFIIANLEYCYGTTNKSAKLQYVRGCEPWEQPICRNIHQKFEGKSGLFKQPSGNTSLGSFDGMFNNTISDCREKCWRDCNCVGYWSNGTGCTIWSGDNLTFEEDSSGNSSHQYVLITEAPAPAPAPASEKKTKKRIPKKWILIVTAAVLSLFALVFGLLCYLKRKRRQGKEKELLELMTQDGYTDTILLEKDGKKGQEVKLFSYSRIVTATDSFSPENKLGEGGFGSVYKGNLVDGGVIAIKRLSRTSGQGLVEFKNELILIAKLQHTNLVRVLGCCIHMDEKMLVYEYMSNKSLDFFLFDSERSSTLDWQKRFNIIEGIAQGLLYLHKYSRMRVIHRDLKASNVLLDDNMNPKISDFGMARIFKPNETEAMTNRVVGTYGYMSPEYAMEGTFSVKSDVFSFGVLILEIVSGRRNNSFYNLDRPLNLVGYAWELWKEGETLELKDPTLGQISEEIQLLKIVHIGLLCVQESATDRPDMSDVISMLCNETLPLHYPKQPIFFTSRSAHKTTASEAKGKDYSINDESISDMEPR